MSLDGGLHQHQHKNNAPSADGSKTRLFCMPACSHDLLTCACCSDDVPPVPTFALFLRIHSGRADCENARWGLGVGGADWRGSSQDSRWLCLRRKPTLPSGGCLALHNLCHLSVSPPRF